MSNEQIIGTIAAVLILALAWWVLLDGNDGRGGYD